MSQKIIFFDIETVSEEKTYMYLNYEKRKVWAERYCKDTGGLTEEQAYYKKASLHAEFGKIVCISVGMYNKEGELRTKSFAGDDEKEILAGFFDLLNTCESDGSIISLCGHHIIGFDIPFVYKRSIINGVIPHKAVNLYGIKPREVCHIDTMEMWKGTGYLSSGLETIALCLGIPSPKEDMDGSEVSEIYYCNAAGERHDTDIKAIAYYCERDVVATAHVYKKMCDPTYTVKIESDEDSPATDINVGANEESRSTIDEHNASLKNMVDNDILPF